ncbi:hypothetical protein LCGC14_2886110, partial [marine sediment metagenome]
MKYTPWRGDLGFVPITHIRPLVEA